MIRKALMALGFVAAVCLVTTVKDAAVQQYHAYEYRQIALNEFAIATKYDAAEAADQTVGNGPYLAFDGTTIGSNCGATAGFVGLCNPQTVGLVSSAATPWSFTNQTAPTTITNSDPAGTTAATAATVFSDTDATNCLTSDATHYAYNFLNGSGASVLSIACGSGGMVLPKSLGVGALLNAQTNIEASSSANAQGELLLGGTNTIGGALGTGSIVFNTTGVIGATTTCAPAAATNAVPEVAAATNGIACVFTSSAATTHTSFQLNFANTFNTAPVCIVQLGSVDVGSSVITTVTNNVGSCAWTTALGVSAGTKFNVIWLGGK
jgi:hypothetical protein